VDAMAARERRSYGMDESAGDFDRGYRYGPHGGADGANGGGPSYYPGFRPYVPRFDPYASNGSDVSMGGMNGDGWVHPAPSYAGMPPHLAGVKRHRSMTPHLPTMSRSSLGGNGHQFQSPPVMGHSRHHPYPPKAISSVALATINPNETTFQRAASLDPSALHTNRASPFPTTIPTNQGLPQSSAEYALYTDQIPNHLAMPPPATHPPSEQNAAVVVGHPLDEEGIDLRDLEPGGVDSDLYEEWTESK